MTACMRRVDLRGFVWKLAALERKLERDVELARIHLASLHREALALEDNRRALDRELREQARIDALRFGSATQRTAFEYLAQVQRRQEQAANSAAALAVRVEHARRACVDVDRQLASVGKLRQGQEQRYARQQQRRADRAADLDWLARGGNTPGPCPGGEATG